MTPVIGKSGSDVRTFYFETLYVFDCLGDSPDPFTGSDVKYRVEGRVVASLKTSGWSQAE
jgi:hypothetical protein